MKLFDKKYLLAQFKNKILLKNGIEFQNFFGDIIEKAISDFQRIKPSGKKGDGGNDGYIKSQGAYYQVYAPETPIARTSEAVKKLYKDFQKLKIKWNKICQIKKYNFVFNDKYSGSVIELEEAISQLEKSDPNIEFKLFLAKDLEYMFFKLDLSDISNLDFDIDSRKAISVVYQYLEKVGIELDRDNSKIALGILVNNRDIIIKLDDQDLCLEYEILECRCYQKLERVDEAKEKYYFISKKYPNDPRSFLYLAEIYFLEKNFVKNNDLLEIARQIDNNHWLLKLEELLKKNHLGEKIDLENINEKDFTDNSRIKASFCRLYALFFEESGNRIKSDYFLGKALILNPDRLDNFIAKLRIIENRMFSDQDDFKKIQSSQELLKEVEKIENNFIKFGEIGPRKKAMLNLIQVRAFYLQDNYSEFKKLLCETFNLILICYFDEQIDDLLIALLMHSSLPDDYLSQLLKYLEETKIEISDQLSNELIIQFNINDNLFNEGRKYFAKNDNKKYLGFISDLENKNYEKLLESFKKDIRFAINFANTAKKFPELRRKIIEILPDDKNIQKEKLLLLLNFDEKNIEEAFTILKGIDLTNLSYFECMPILEIIQEKKAWDFEIIVLEKLLEKEKDNKIFITLKQNLFSAFINLKKYLEVIEVGDELLKQDSNENKVTERNREYLLFHTIHACLERGKIDTKFLIKSQEILEKHQLAHPTFEFKAGIEAEVYLKNNKPDKALKSVIEGVKIKKNLTPDEYVKLYFVMNIQIGNIIGLNLESLYKIDKNTFVKLKNKDRWYFIGSDNELDAIKISDIDTKYSLFIDRKIKDEIVFKNKYSDDTRVEVIEKIYSIDKYILWQSSQNFDKLSSDNDLDGVQKIKIPKKNGIADFTYLLKYFEDIKKITEPIFEIYCKNNVPLAVLAVVEGGLINAFGRVQQEKKGFINFSTEYVNEFDKQKDIAKDIIDNKMPFYIDGTSALVLSETGIFKKVYAHLPNLKVPQSVINFMINNSEKFKFKQGQLGYMGYAQGKIILSSIEKDKSDLIYSNFQESIELMEAKPMNISVISLANKCDCMSEQKVHEELSDACILAQKEKTPVLTEDFLYLKMNEFETKKKSPEYFSSLALLRVLYEEGKVSFEEFLDFFGYLASYRFRFLLFSYDDIEKAIFGDGKIKIINPTNIRKLNFSLTLSAEYGVPYQKALIFIRKFMLRVLTDNSVTMDIAEKILFEIIETFPIKMNKKKFGQMLLMSCKSAIENNKSKFVLFPKNHIVFKKIEKLLQAIEFFEAKMCL